MGVFSKLKEKIFGSSAIDKFDSAALRRRISWLKDRSYTTREISEKLGVNIRKVRRILKETTEVEDEEIFTFDREFFIYVEIPNPTGTDDPDEIADKINPLLREKGVAEISGVSRWIDRGSGHSDEMPDGNHSIAYCGLEIDVFTDLDTARVLLRDILSSLGMPEGTTLKL